mmetsp:Transcript_33989/g.80019  ORF Transcript_33989/g.80019 Transcript_33989/m.80019 type:complete len:100 (+) Transcript_33989:47-346(+)
MQITMVRCNSLAFAICSALLIANQGWALSLSNKNQNGMDRRSAIQQAGISAAAFGTTTASGLLLPNSPQLARAAGTDTINPIATLADGSKFPLASFGLQ